MADTQLTLDEAARLMEIDQETVRRWVARGLPATEQPDGTITVRRADLDEFLRREGQGTSRDAATEV